MIEKQPRAWNPRFAMNTKNRRQGWVLALGCSLAITMQAGHAEGQSTHNQSAAHTDTHTVEQGETLWDIAEKYLGDPREWRQLQQGSGVEEPRLLQPGTKIAIPEATGVFPATVLHLEGQGWRVTSAGEEPLAVGMNLDGGEVIRTGADTYLSLAFADDSRLVLPSLTAVTLSAGPGRNSPRVILQDGEVEAYVQQQSGKQRRRLEVETPVGVLGVRGTHFRVRNGDERTLTEVLEGRVASNRADTSGPAINGGYGLVMKPSGPLNTVKLLPAPASAEQRQLVGAEPSWQVRAAPISGAASYHAEVSASSDFMRIVQAQSAGQPQFDFSGLEAAYYHVRIAAVDGEGLRGMPATFVLPNRGFDPTVSVENVSGGVEFRWSRPAGWRYGFQIALDEDFRQPFADKRNLAGDGVLIGRLPAGRYYWRLFLDSDAGEGQPLEVVNSGVVAR